MVGDSKCYFLLLITGQDHTWIFVSCGVGAMFIIGTVAMVILLYRRNYARSKYEPFDWPEPDVKHYDGK